MEKRDTYACAGSFTPRYNVVFAVHTGLKIVNAYNQFSISYQY